MFDRSQLVHQWQDRLSAAEGLADGTPRFRWYHAARIRLYRFLLRCYGSGQWRSALQEAVPPPQEVVGQAEGETWSGKPPKGEGKIRSVLKSVHLAQDEAAHKSGPKLAGVGPRDYVAVTANDAMIDVGQCREFLNRNGISARIAHRGRQKVVEVPFADLAKASYLVDTYQGELRPETPTRLGKLRHFPILTAPARAVLVSAVFASLAFIFSLTAGFQFFHWYRREIPTEGLYVAIGAETLALVCLLVLACTYQSFVSTGHLETLSFTPDRRAGRKAHSSRGLSLGHLILLSWLTAIPVCVGTAVAAFVTDEGQTPTLGSTPLENLCIVAIGTFLTFLLTFTLCIVTQPQEMRSYLLARLDPPPNLRRRLIAAFITVPICILPLAITATMAVNASRLSGQLSTELAGPILTMVIFLFYAAGLWWAERRLK